MKLNIESGINEGKKRVFIRNFKITNSWPCIGYRYLPHFGRFLIVLWNVCSLKKTKQKKQWFTIWISTGKWIVNLVSFTWIQRVAAATFPTMFCYPFPPLFLSLPLSLLHVSFFTLFFFRFVLPLATFKYGYSYFANFPPDWSSLLAGADGVIGCFTMTGNFSPAKLTVRYFRERRDWQCQSYTEDPSNILDDKDLTHKSPECLEWNLAWEKLEEFFPLKYEI